MYAIYLAIQSIYWSLFSFFHTKRTNNVHSLKSVYKDSQVCSNNKYCGYFYFMVVNQFSIAFFANTLR